MSAKTIDQWLSVLQASNQVELLEPYFANIGKRIVKSPKPYFCDTGLLCFLLGVDAGTLGTSPWLGAIWGWDAAQGARTAGGNAQRSRSPK